MVPTGFAKTAPKEIGEVLVGLKTPITVVEKAQAINYMDSGSVELGAAKAKKMIRTIALTFNFVWYC